jgi:hypothetical protein
MLIYGYSLAHQLFTNEAACPDMLSAVLSVTYDAVTGDH